jgi:mono/diheme cytochrome c family protein
VSLGLETRQLNLEQFYPETGRTANQFDTLLAIGMLGGDVSSLPPLPSKDTTVPLLDMQAEAYLHVNCAHCHRPGGTGQGLADYRYDTLLGGMNVCNEPSLLSAYPGFDLLEPGSAADSVLWLRTSTRGQNQMPPIASTVVDNQGAQLLEEWINSMTACP